VSASIPLALDDLIRIEEVKDCAFYARELFREAFAAEPPDFPHHFVAMYRAARNCFVVVGYLHCSVLDDLCLCGGLVQDGRAIRRMPADHQAALRSSGGLGRRLLEAASACFAHMPALWARVGDQPLRDIFHAAKFEAAPPQYLMVRWNRDIGDAARKSLLNRVGEHGPF